MNGMRLHAIGAAILLAASAASALAADSPSQRWEAWRQAQLAGPPERALPRLAWAFFGDSGIPADDKGFATYAAAGLTYVQTHPNQAAMSAAESQGLKLFLGTWEGAVGKDDKVHDLAAKASADNSVSLMMLKDEADASLLEPIGHDNDILYRETPSRVLVLQTILPAHASKAGNKERWDPQRPCKDDGSYCDFVHHVIQTAHPAAVGITLYPLLQGGDRAGYYRELGQLRKQTESAKIGLAGFVLVTPHYDGWSKQRYKRPELSDVLWQVNSLLANNAKLIVYYDYRIKPENREEKEGAFAEGMVSASDGQPTDTYGSVQKANCEIAGIGSTLMGLNVRETYWPEDTKGKFVPAATQAGPVNVAGNDLLISTLEPEGGSGSSWVMIVNEHHGAGSSASKAQLQLPAGFNAVQTSADQDCHAKKTPLSVASNGWVGVEVPPGGASLIEIARKN